MKLRILIALGFVWNGALPMFAQYGGFGGPSILSRGGGSGGRQPDNPVSFSAFAGVGANYRLVFNADTPLLPGEASQRNSSFGATASAGLAGYKIGRRSSTSVQLGANYGVYQRAAGTTNANYGGFLTASHSRQLTRRTSWFLGASLRTTNNTLQRGGYGETEIDTGDPVVESTSFEDDFFDSGVFSGSVATGLSFQKSNRLSFSIQGAAFGVERQRKNLVDSRGFQGSGSMQYRLSQRTYTGIQYSYGTFYFPGRYGESEFMTAQAFIGRQLSRSWTVQLGGGPLSVHSTRVQSVPIDPIIAIITGQRTALEIVDRELLTYGAQASLNGNFRSSNFSASYSRGIRPGSGLYETAISELVHLKYSYRVLRDVRVTALASARQSRSEFQDTGAARTYSAGLATGYRISESLSVSGSARLIRVEAFGERLRSDYVTATVGLHYSPGELPFHIF